MKSVSADTRFVRFPESVPEIENITVMRANQVEECSRSSILSRSYELTKWPLGADLDVLKGYD